MVLSNKSILPLLWEMFPGHPNLLPAYTTPERLDGNYVRKPTLGREGAGITTVGRAAGRRHAARDGEREIRLSSVAAAPGNEGRYPVIGSWIVRDEAAGIGIREGESRSRKTPAASCRILCAVTRLTAIY